eukprot:COSAG04_NODE_10234_length_794_cov_1.129496_1_plen_111_part_10
MQLEGLSASPALALQLQFRSAAATPAAERTTMDGSALLPALAADPAEARERKESGKMAFLGDSFASLLVSNKQGLGAVMGVFVPCVLSIIGVVLFMRLGWAIGEPGVVGVL